MQTSAIQYRSIAGERRREGRGNLLLWQLLKVQAVVDAHLSEYISSRQLADCVRLSRYHFARAFRRSTGMSPQGYVIRCRIERAQYLMLWTDTTLSRIAFECGFSDQSHFSRTFVKALGETPRAWRRAQLATAGRIRDERFDKSSKRLCTQHQSELEVGPHRHEAARPTVGLANEFAPQKAQQEQPIAPQKLGGAITRVSRRTKLWVSQPEAHKTAATFDAAFTANPPYPP